MTSVKIYAVRDRATGKFYRSYAVRRYAGTGWEDNIADAKLYTKPGPAKGCVTALSRLRTPIDAEVVELTAMTDADRRDSSQRVALAALLEATLKLTEVDQWIKDGGSLEELTVMFNALVAEVRTRTV